jgi:hypothetical protein|tara:strand:+ start:2254 stop:2472 length:219 start_codon:yes stop_codon:yes gene_type:complete
MFILDEKKIATIIKFLDHPKCTDKLKVKLEKRSTDKGKWNLAKGWLENWETETKLKRKFKSMFVRGGLMSPK